MKEKQDDNLIKRNKIIDKNLKIDPLKDGFTLDEELSIDVYTKKDLRNK